MFYQGAAPCCSTTPCFSWHDGTRAGTAPSGIPPVSAFFRYARYASVRVWTGRREVSCHHRIRYTIVSPKARIKINQETKNIETCRRCRPWAIPVLQTAQKSRTRGGMVLEGGGAASAAPLLFLYRENHPPGEWSPNKLVLVQNDLPLLSIEVRSANGTKKQREVVQKERRKQIIAYDGKLLNSPFTGGKQRSFTADGP